MKKSVKKVLAAVLALALIASPLAAVKKAATAKKHRVTTTQQTTQSISLVQQALLQAIMLPTVTP